MASKNSHKGKHVINKLIKTQLFRKSCTAKIFALFAFRRNVPGTGLFITR
jgi:hypothetical protein